MYRMASFLNDAEAQPNDGHSFSTPIVPIPSPCAMDDCSGYKSTGTARTVSRTVDQSVKVTEGRLP